MTKKTQEIINIQAAVPVLIAEARQANISATEHFIAALVCMRLEQKAKELVLLLKGTCAYTIAALTYIRTLLNDPTDPKAVRRARSEAKMLQPFIDDGLLPSCNQYGGLFIDIASETGDDADLDFARRQIRAGKDRLIQADGFLDIYQYTREEADVAFARNIIKQLTDRAIHVTLKLVRLTKKREDALLFSTCLKHTLHHETDEDRIRGYLAIFASTLDRFPAETVQFIYRQSKDDRIRQIMSETLSEKLRIAARSSN